MPPVTFEVVVRTLDGMTAAVLQASVDPPPTAGSSGPVYFEIPLGAFGGQSVDVAFATYASQPIAMANLTAYWVSPQILSAG